MQVRGFFTLAIVGLARAQASSTTDGGVMVGGYSEMKPIPEPMQTFLYEALANVTLYSSNIKARVCTTALTKLERQTVAGTNYRFTTSGCDVVKTLKLQTNQSPGREAITAQMGQCKADVKHNCVEVDAVVTIYQDLQNTTHVTNIVTTPKHDDTAAHIRVRVHAAPN